MTQKLNKTLLAIAALASSMLTSSCDKNESFDNDDLYYVTSYNTTDIFFKPKKLNIFYIHNGVINGNWLYSEGIDSTRIRWNDHIIDYQQVNAEHYYFLNQTDIKKYVDMHNASMKEVFIDTNDIINPYKKYAEYFGDTILKTHHGTGAEYSGSNICVMPITGIDVTCDKNFDEKHPVGTPLNDIIQYLGYKNLYKYLNEKDENGVPLHQGKRLYDFYQHTLDTNYCYNVTLSDIPEHPLIMAIEHFTLEFTHTPTEHGRYEFTVKFSFGPDPLSGETVDIAPAKVSIEF